jgi:hypothetical protein
MKVILSVPDEGYSRKASCALNWISTFLICFITTASHVGKSGTPSDICVVDSAYVRFANVYF